MPCVLGRIKISIMHFLDFICVKMHDFCVNAIPDLLLSSVTRVENHYFITIVHFCVCPKPLPMLGTCTSSCSNARYIITCIHVCACKAHKMLGPVVKGLVLNFTHICLFRSMYIHGHMSNYFTIRPIAHKGYGSIAYLAKPNGLLTHGP